MPKEKMINAPQITVSARHRPAMEPRMIVKPVTMSAADFRRLPNGSRAHCSALSRLAPPERTMLNPLSTPWSDPNLLSSYSCWKVGQYTAFSGYEGMRQGKIHFGGEHCSQDFQGYMEGGASEGVRAAGEILDDLR